MKVIILSKSVDSFIKFTKLALLVLVLNSIHSVSAKPLEKIYELDYRNSSTIEVPSGTKATVRLHSVPFEADAVQVSLAHDTHYSGAHILGPSNLLISKNAGSNYVEFNIEMPKSTGRFYNRKLKLNIKTFQRTSDDGYKILEKIENYISPIS